MAAIPRYVRSFAALGAGSGSGAGPGARLLLDQLASRPPTTTATAHAAFRRLAAARPSTGYQQTRFYSDSDRPPIPLHGIDPPKPRDSHPGSSSAPPPPTTSPPPPTPPPPPFYPDSAPPVPNHLGPEPDFSDLRPQPDPPAATDPAPSGSSTEEPQRKDTATSAASESSDVPSSSSTAPGGAEASRETPGPHDGPQQSPPPPSQLAQLAERAQAALAAASRRINDLTGYAEIESLKASVGALERGREDAQQALHAARAAYKEAVSERSSTQREVTTLLARQKTWTPADFERFTLLYRRDYDLDADVARRAADLEAAERRVERVASDLATAILARYHEEQVWSDKIRRMSTWGTWGLMAVNVLLFFAFQFGAEPWRRARLVRGFEDKVREAIAAAAEDQRSAAAAAAALALAQQQQQQQLQTQPSAAGTSYVAVDASPAAAADPVPAASETGAAAPAAAPPPIPWRELLSSPDAWRRLYVNLSSDRPVALRARDVSVIALEAAGAAALATACAAFLLVARR